VPVQLGQLLGVPHIWPYSARALVTFANYIPTAIVDSNIVQVFGRTFQSTLGQNPRVKAVQILADQVLPADKHKEFNWGS